MARRLACTSSNSQDGIDRHGEQCFLKFSNSVALVEDLKELQSARVARIEERIVNAQRMDDTPL